MYHCTNYVYRKCNGIYHRRYWGWSNWFMCCGILLSAYKKVSEWIPVIMFSFSSITSVDTKNVLSKRQVWMSIFHIINFKKKKFMDTGVLDIFNKKLILYYYFCLKSGPVFLFQIFIIAPHRFLLHASFYHAESVCFKLVIQSGRSLFLSKIKIHR